MAARMVEACNDLETPAKPSSATSKPGENLHEAGAIGRGFFVHPAWPKVGQKKPTDSHKPSRPSGVTCHADHVVASAVVIPVIIAGANSAATSAGSAAWPRSVCGGFLCAGGVLVAFGFLEAR